MDFHFEVFARAIGAPDRLSRTKQKYVQIKRDLLRIPRLNAGIIQIDNNNR